MVSYCSRRDQPWSLRSCFQEKSNQNDKQWYFLKCAVSCRLAISRSLWHVRHVVSMHMIKDMCISFWAHKPTGFFAPFALRIYVFNVNAISISCCPLHYVCLWNVILVIRMAIFFLIWFDLILCIIGSLSFIPTGSAPLVTFCNNASTLSRAPGKQFGVWEQWRDPRCVQDDGRIRCWYGQCGGESRTEFESNLARLVNPISFRLYELDLSISISGSWCEKWEYLHTQIRLLELVFIYAYNH